MTPKEAIDNLKYLISEDCTESQFEFIPEIELAIEALSVVEQIRWERDITLEQLEEIGVGLGAKMDNVKEALEKQIPKKPDVWRKKNEWALIPFELPFGDWGYECPCCGSRDIDYPDHHCKCGQAIDWSGEE